MEDWPWADKVCQLEFHLKRLIKDWSLSIKDGFVDTKCHTLVLYLEGLASWSEVPPIKNCLQAIATALRKKHPRNRIFVSNLLPANTSPISMSRDKFNFVLTQATCSVSRALGKIHVLSLYEHFVSDTGRMVKLADQYFKQRSPYRIGMFNDLWNISHRGWFEELLVRGWVALEGGIYCEKCDVIFRKNLKLGVESDAIYVQWEQLTVMCVIIFYLQTFYMCMNVQIFLPNRS